MPLEIATPFHLGVDKRVVTTSNPDTQVRQHVQSLVNTQPTERVMLDKYGVDTQSLLFEDADPGEVAASVSIRVNSAFQNWEPGVELTAAVPVVSSDAALAQIDVQYRRRDNTLSTLNSVNTAIIGSNGTVKEYLGG